jgi:hypothetical protein
MLKKLELMLSVWPENAETLGDVHGYPITKPFFLHMKSYFQFVIEEWQAQKILTDPYFLYGVDYIQPHPLYRYTKKLIVLTNELDFSGADFFPAILQDSERALIVGTKTAGAGGYVLSNSDRNGLGILQYSYTGSHALRANGEPLEDKGITPDIAYEILPEDLRTDFAFYRLTINAIVKEYLEHS